MAWEAFMNQLTYRRTVIDWSVGVKWSKWVQIGNHHSLRPNHLRLKFQVKVFTFFSPLVSHDTSQIFLVIHRMLGRNVFFACLLPFLCKIPGNVEQFALHNTLNFEETCDQTLSGQFSLSRLEAMKWFPCWNNFLQTDSHPGWSPIQVLIRLC